MPTQHTAQSRPERISREMSRCRQRGLDELDIDMHKLPPVPAEELTKLAEDHCAALGKVVYSRAEAIRTLIEDGLRAYAKRGYGHDGAIIVGLYFTFPDTLADEKQTDIWALLPAATSSRKDASVRLDRVQEFVGLAGKDREFAALRHEIFDRFANFLVWLVEGEVPAIAEEPPTTAVIDAGNQAVARQRRRWPIGAGIVAALLIIIGGLVVTHQLPDVSAWAHPQGPAVSVFGTVKCLPDATQPVVGVWVDAPNGGSGWATWHALPGQPNVAYFNRTLPHGGSYFVHVGCGGSPHHWGVPTYSVTAVKDSGHMFTCHDIYHASDPLYGQCLL